MQIKDIKTESQFYEMADIWYQRSHKIREIWQNPDTPEPYAEKAFNIWLKLSNRMQYLVQVGFEISQPKPPKGSENLPIVTDFNDPLFKAGKAVILAKPNFKD